MDIVPLLSTIILIATAVTLIVAVVSYLIFRIKERRREARAAAALRRKQVEVAGAGESSTDTASIANRRQEDRRQPVNVLIDNNPVIVPDRRSTDRRQNTNDDHLMAKEEFNRRSEDRREPAQVDSRGIPQPEFNRRQTRRREDGSPEIPRRKTDFATGTSQPMLEAFGNHRAFPPASPQTPGFRTANPSLSGAQSAFIESLNLSDNDRQNLNNRLKSLEDSDLTDDRIQSEAMKFRRFSIGSNSKPKKGLSSFHEDKLEWK